MLKRIKNTTSYIRHKLGIDQSNSPTIGIVLGSGLGSLVECIDIQATLPYGEIPDFPQSSVAGHKGQFVLGSLAGKQVIAMQGRIHYYEGYTMEEVVLPIRVMGCLGVETLIVSNAAGGVNLSFAVGDIMVISDHINMIPNPLIGRNIDELGTRFPDMSCPYDKPLRDLAFAIADQEQLSLREGVYAALTGPSFETPAEYRFMRTIGADAVGMSTAPEVVAARHMGVRVLGLSLISNLGGTAVASVATHQEVSDAATRAMDKMNRLVCGIIAQL